MHADKNGLGTGPAGTVLPDEEIQNTIMDTKMKGHYTYMTCITVESTER